MQSKTFVVGAGFSAGAGFPLVRNLLPEVLQYTHNTTDPLLRTFVDRRMPEFPDGQLQEELRAVGADGSMGFEELLVALRRANRGEPRYAVAYLLRSACAKLLWEKDETLGTIPITYRNFASWMNEFHGRGQHNAIISLNWDLLAERALDGLSWGYSTLQPIPIIKPHGSINWSHHLQLGGQADCRWWQPISPGSPYCYIPADPNDPDCIGPFRDPFREANDCLRQMIFPGDPEHEDGLAQIWSEAERVIRERDVVVFIGYSLPSYDVPAQDFFRRTTRGKIVEVYTPSPEVLQHYAKSLPNVVTTDAMSFQNCPYALNPCK